MTSLAEPFAMSLPAISKHLKVLERAGLIARGREAQWRPCRLKASPLKDAADWLEHYRRFWDQSFDRLEDHLRDVSRRRRSDMSAGNSTATANRELVVTRIFDAPLAVWCSSAWTEPEQVARWWGPRGFVTTHCDMDIRPGGAFRCCMRSPAGTDHWKRGIYREIVKPARIVFTFAWEDARAGKSRATKLLTTVTFDQIT